MNKYLIDTKNKWILTSDTHGNFDRFEHLNQDEPISIIILGDFSIDFYLNKKDEKNKTKLLEKYPNFTFYAVRGNHEQRPEKIPGVEKVYDDAVQGEVWCHPTWPRIKYFIDGGEYIIDGYSVLTIGGAYSVDKDWRLANGYTWFPGEQLTIKERESILYKVKNKTYDFVFTHTCPYDWRPVDKFLPMIDQSKVDSSTELWLMELKQTINFGVWCWGHFHDDRLEAPYAQMFYHTMDELRNVAKRWEEYKATGYLDWWLVKSPNFYAASSKE